MHRFTIPFLVSFATLTGCSFDSASEGSVETLYERLGRRETLSLADPSLVGVSAYDRDGAPLPCVQPDVIGGEAVLRATSDGVLLVEALDVGLSNITIEAGVVFQNDTLELTDIELLLGTQIAVAEPAWSDDGASVSGVGRGDLLMNWAILADNGDHLPLATQRIRDAEFRVEARAERGIVTAEITTAVEGTFWDFTAVELADFAMAVNASSIPSIE